MSNFLSGVAVLLSTLALVFSGFTTYQVFTIQQTLNANRGIGGVNPNQLYSTQAPNSAANARGSIATASPSPATDSLVPASTSPSSSASIQRSQFVKPAFRNKGQVELLKVNRIPGQQDIVNVQVRIRALRPEKATGSDAMYIGGTTARNLQTSETYVAANGESTGSVSLFSMRLENQASADAYVWLRVPEGVNTLDIYIPNTEAFTNVPISSS